MPREDSKNDLKLRSEEVQEILSNPPIWIVRWGITLIFMLTIILLALTFIIRYPDFVSAKVIVTTKRPTERIVARFSGPLERLYIKNGDVVREGQCLAVIRNTANVDDVHLLKTILDTLNHNPESFTFPLKSVSGSMLGDIGSAYINFEKSYLDFQLLKELDTYRNQLAGNRTSLIEIRAQLINQIKQKKLLEQELELKTKDFVRYETLFEKGVISQQEYENKKVELLQIKKNTSSMAILISQIREAIASASYALRGTQISEEEDYVRFYTNLFQSYNTLKKAMHDWEYTYELTSSIEGKVSFQEFWGENQFVNSGEVVFTVLPENMDTLVGKLILPSQNAGRVIIGQKVLVKLDNFPFQRYGILLGKVQNISVSPNKEGNYYVYISLPQGTYTSYNRRLPFNQELLGKAEIITEDLSVAERIFYKFKNIFNSNS